jgi:hypothetical protein
MLLPSPRYIDLYYRALQLFLTIFYILLCDLIFSRYICIDTLRKKSTLHSFLAVDEVNVENYEPFLGLHVA